MIGNIKRTFPPKTGLREKQLLQDPGYVKDRGDSCCMLPGILQNNVENVKDIKTSHNRFLTDFLEFISLLSKTSKMCMNYNVDSNTKPSNYSKI